MRSTVHLTFAAVVIKNVIFSLVHSDISHAVRLSSVWPINFQYHNQSCSYRLQLCNSGAYHHCAHFKHL